MKNSLTEKLHDFLEILVTIIFDMLLVIVSAFVVSLIRIILERIFGTPIDDLDKTISIVYYVSEIVIITVGILYSVLDVALLMKKIYFRITQRQNP